MKDKRAPQISTLKDLEIYIRFLQEEQLPYTAIDGRNLEKKKSNNSITNDEYEEILIWKRTKSFSDSQTFFQDITSLANMLGIVEKVSMGNSQLDGYFSTTSVSLSKLADGKKLLFARMTPLGYRMAELLVENEITNYNRMIFWCILRSELSPIWQIIFQKPEIFSENKIKEIMSNAQAKSDAITVSFFLNASKYLGLFDFNTLQNTGEVFDKNIVGKNLFYSTVLEINTYEKNHYFSIEELVSRLTHTFETSNVDFLLILKILFEKERERKDPQIEGGKSSTRSLSLPLSNSQSVSLLRIIGDLDIATYENFNAEEVLEIIQ